jgi:hypothetical protein
LSENELDDFVVCEVFCIIQGDNLGHEPGDAALLTVELREKGCHLLVDGLSIDSFICSNLFNDLLRISALDLGDMPDFPLLLLPSELGANGPIIGGLLLASFLVAAGSPLLSILL